MLAKIAEMPEPGRSMAKRFHAIVKASAPALSPRLWYGMPAYAKDGAVISQGADRAPTRCPLPAASVYAAIRTPPRTVKGANPVGDEPMRSISYGDSARCVLRALCPRMCPRSVR